MSLSRCFQVVTPVMNLLYFKHIEIEANKHIEASLRCITSLYCGIWCAYILQFIYRETQKYLAIENKSLIIELLKLMNNNCWKLLYTSLNLIIFKILIGVHKLYRLYTEISKVLKNRLLAVIDECVRLQTGTIPSMSFCSTLPVISSNTLNHTSSLPCDKSKLFANGNDPNRNRLMFQM